MQGRCGDYWGSVSGIKCGIIHVRCGYYRWGSRDAIRYSDIDAASVCIGSHSAG